MKWMRPTSTTKQKSNFDEKLYLKYTRKVEHTTN